MEVPELNESFLFGRFFLLPVGRPGFLEFDGSFIFGVLYVYGALGSGLNYFNASSTTSRSAIENGLFFEPFEDPKKDFGFLEIFKPR